MPFYGSTTFTKAGCFPYNKAGEKREMKRNTWLLPLQLPVLKEEFTVPPFLFFRLLFLLRRKPDSPIFLLDFTYNFPFFLLLSFQKANSLLL